MEYAGRYDKARLLEFVERAENLMKERRRMEREMQGRVADALDDGMCVRSFEFGLALAHVLARRSASSRPPRLADILRGGFYTDLS